MSRYDVPGSEGEYEAGSDNKVLRNKAGLIDPADMNIAETELLEDLYFKAIQAGRDGDYQHVERLIRDVLEEQ